MDTSNYSNESIALLMTVLATLGDCKEAVNEMAIRGRGVMRNYPANSIPEEERQKALKFLEETKYIVEML